MTTKLRIITYRILAYMLPLLTGKGMKIVVDKSCACLIKFCTGKYITEEPDAVVPHVRICLGAAG